MTDDTTKPASRKPRRIRSIKDVWRRIRGPIAQARAVSSSLAWIIAQYLRFVRLTNRRVPGSSQLDDMKRGGMPFIAAAWHGQHLMAPTLIPDGVHFVVMVSKSRDAELNARVAESFGGEVIRGSGGRDARKSTEKGGARALLVLKNALKQGKSAAMIADIPHGTPREAGGGVILLAKLSGRPIIPIAYATSRRKVMEKSWDKTAIPLPFGRSGLVIGDPIFVSDDSDDAMLEAKRVELTDTLQTITGQVYDLVDGKAGMGRRR
ncbi:MAG: lysophospholipid acyltransferase family protein [Phyllobacterium sp.]